MLEFKPVASDDFEPLDSFLKEYGSSSCQHSFPAMLGLYDKYGDEYCFHDGVLLVHRSHRDREGCRVYLAPLGNIGECDMCRYVRMILDDARSHSARVSFETVTEDFKDVLLSCRDLSCLFEAGFTRDYSEYIYSVETLSHLPGRGLSPKRNRVRAFHSVYEGRFSIEPINRSNLEDIRYFSDCWFRERMTSPDDPGLESESKAISVYLNHFENLGFRGIAVYIDGKIVGYAAGVPISVDTMDEVIEKGVNDVTGIYQLLCNEFALRCCEGFTYINREEDLGLQGLRRAKESYQPVRMMNKFIIKER